MDYTTRWILFSLAMTTLFSFLYFFKPVKTKVKGPEVVKKETEERRDVFFLFPSMLTIFLPLVYMLANKFMPSHNLANKEYLIVAAFFTFGGGVATVLFRLFQGYSLKDSLMPKIKFHILTFKHEGKEYRIPVRKTVYEKYQEGDKIKTLYLQNRPRIKQLDWKVTGVS